MPGTLMNVIFHSALSNCACIIYDFFSVDMCNMTNDAMSSENSIEVMAMSTHTASVEKYGMQVMIDTEITHDLMHSNIMQSIYCLHLMRLIKIEQLYCVSIFKMMRSYRWNSNRFNCMHIQIDTAGIVFWLVFIYFVLLQLNIRLQRCKISHFQKI